VIDPTNQSNQKGIQRNKCTQTQTSKGLEKMSERCKPRFGRNRLEINRTTEQRNDRKAEQTDKERKQQM
jgi:hypothetical protein